MPWLHTPVIPLFRPSDRSPQHSEVQGCHSHIPADRVGVGVGYSRLGGEEEEDLGSYERFMALIRVVLYHPPEGRGGGERLFQLQQDGQIAAQYTLTFQTVAASSGWNEPALCTLFSRGLCKEVGAPGRQPFLGLAHRNGHTSWQPSSGAPAPTSLLALLLWLS